MDAAAGSAKTPFYLVLTTPSGRDDVQRDADRSRRCFSFDPFARPSASDRAARLRDHAEWLAARQRASNVRIRLCLTGCYSIYNDQGQFVARTPTPSDLFGLSAGHMRTSAARMAYAEELAAVCRVVDLDYEQSGSVAPSTIVAMRELLATIGAA
jgi:hypothetical protein